MIILDTESTGLQQNQVCQLAWIEVVGSEIEPFNAFFAVDDMNPHAAAVNGFTVASLERLSGGHRFGEMADELAARLRGHRIVGHSISSDLRALRMEFDRAGILYKAAGQFCTMTYFAPVMNLRLDGSRRPKMPSLTELCDYVGIGKGEASELATSLYGSRSAAHDARYDVCATYLCLEKAEAKGLLRDLLPKEVGESGKRHV